MTTNDESDLHAGDQSADGSPEAGRSASESTIVDDVERLREELDQTRDRALRLQADFDNYRKRSQRDADEQRKFASVSLLSELLPVLDNIERAMAAAEKAPDAASVAAGFKMVLQQFEGVLTRFNCQPIEAQNQPFDPHLHAAIAQQPSDEHAPNTVLHVVQRGYQLHDRVLRPAQVIVSTAAPTE